MKGLVWFRNDLRIDDNPSLRKAFEECTSVIAIYLWSEEQMLEHNEANIKQDFIIQNLHSLSLELEKFNVPLQIIKSKGFLDADIKIENFIHEHRNNKIYFNKA